MSLENVFRSELYRDVSEKKKRQDRVFKISEVKSIEWLKEKPEIDKKTFLGEGNISDFGKTLCLDCFSRDKIEYSQVENQNFINNSVEVRNGSIFDMGLFPDFDNAD